MIKYLRKIRIDDKVWDECWEKDRDRGHGM